MHLLVDLPMHLLGVLHKALNFNCYCSSPNAENVTWPSRFTFIWKLKKKVGRKVSVFVLTIRNKSLYSGKITTYLNIEKMSLNLLTALPKKENRDANRLQRS